MLSEALNISINGVKTNQDAATSEANKRAMQKKLELQTYIKGCCQADAASDEGIGRALIVNSTGELRQEDLEEAWAAHAATARPSRQSPHTHAPSGPSALFTCV